MNIWTSERATGDGKNFIMRRLIICTNTLLRVHTKGDETGGHTEHTGKMRNAYTIWVGETIGEQIILKIEVSWENIRLDLKDMRWRGLACNNLVRDRY
jgi:hypothetical protein